MVRAASRRIWSTVGWAGAVTAAVLNGVVVGYGALAARSAVVSSQAAPGASHLDTAWDGIGSVLWAPWTWALVALGMHGLYRLVGTSGASRPHAR